MAFLLYFISALSLGVSTNGIGVLASGAVFLLLQKRTGTKKALCYACFFLAGAAVAKLQWMIFTDRDPSEVGFQIWATAALVGAATVTGLVASWRFLIVNKILMVLVAMTVVLAFLQFGGAPFSVLNGYARLYALVCLLAPLMGYFTLRRG